MDYYSLFDIYRVLQMMLWIAPMVCNFGSSVKRSMSHYGLEVAIIVTWNSTRNTLSI